MAKKLLLVTAFGKDHAGLVAGVTRVLWEKGGNIEDSSMTRLGGEFCMMLMVSTAENVGAEALAAAYRKIGKDLGMDIRVKDLPAQVLRRASEEGLEPFLISVYGTDKPGIVHRVTQTLAEAHVNITDLNTKKIPQPKKDLYVMLIEVAAPPPVNVESLQRLLKKIGDEMRVDITVRELDPVAL